MTVIAIEPPESSLLDAIGAGLRAHNVAFGGAPIQPDEFVVTLRTADGALLGGVTCDIYLGGMHIEWAWIEQAHRGCGFGRQLIATAETEGVRRGATMVHLDTFTFQARGFYEKCGYVVFATLEYPNQVKRFYMRKDLGSPCSPS